MRPMTAVIWRVFCCLARRMTPVIGAVPGARDDADAMTPPALAFPDFNRAPFLVIWEVTRACALACVHCRADAIHRRDPRSSPPRRPSG